MPTYEYKCNKCAHEFELLQSMKDEPVKACPKCGGSVKRLIGAGGGFIFKGPGFYATDYRKPDRKPKKDKDSSGEKKPDQCKNCDKKDCGLAEKG